MIIHVSKSEIPINFLKTSHSPSHLNTQSITHDKHVILNLAGRISIALKEIKDQLKTTSTPLWSKKPRCPIRTNQTVSGYITLLYFILKKGYGDCLSNGQFIKFLSLS